MAGSSPAQPVGTRDIALVVSLVQRSDIRGYAVEDPLIEACVRGPSGSWHTKAKDSVPCGVPLQDSGGDLLSPTDV